VHLLKPLKVFKMNNKEQRQQSALARLQQQLQVGTKPEKIEGRTTGNQVPLTSTDKARIEREIESLSNNNQIL
jgi:hypothetical protein